MSIPKNLQMLNEMKAVPPTHFKSFIQMHVACQTSKDQIQKQHSKQLSLNLTRNSIGLQGNQYLEKTTEIT